MLKLTLIGNLGSDAELQYATSGQPHLRFNVAGNFRTRTAEGAYEDRTEWVRVTMFGGRAEPLANLLKKGQKVYVDGRLEARPWTGKDGVVHAGLEVIASEVELCGSRPAEHEDRQMMRPTNTVNRQPAPAGASHESDVPF